jgi:hypothetical protein
MVIEMISRITKTDEFGERSLEMNKFIYFCLILSTSISVISRAEAGEILCRANENSLVIDKTTGTLTLQKDEGGDSPVVVSVRNQVKLVTGKKENTFDLVSNDGKVLMTIQHNGDPSSRYGTAQIGQQAYLCTSDQQLLEYSAPQSKGQYCQGLKSLSNIQNMLMDSGNRLAFPNGPYGLMNGGVCWWHSKFERNAAYLAIYQPKSPKPDHATGMQIIASLKNATSVVMIPGYKNLHDFSADYRREIISTLESWQVQDGIGFAWIRGLNGTPSVDPDTLQKTMDDTYRVVQGQKLIAFLMLKLPGIESHAWLVLHMTKVPGGYDLVVTDSNFVNTTLTLNFRYGMRQLGNYGSAPFLQDTYDNEDVVMINEGRGFCSTVSRN